MTMHQSLLSFIARLSRATPRVSLVMSAVDFKEPAGDAGDDLGDLLLNAFNLPPDKAIEAMEAKGYKITWSWKDMKAEAHAKAFTVAKVMKLDILKDIHSEVRSALEKGTTLQTFQENLMPTLKAKGWWGKVPANQVPTDDPNFLPPGAGDVQLGSPWRLQTIFRTNLQTAYMAGRYQGMQDVVAVRPYWQYISVMDAMTRPAHAAMNGRVFPHDDPIWNSFYPPNGYNCRCRVRSLSARELQRYGLEVSNSGGSPPTDQKGRPLTPDEGFDYNPGEASRSFLAELAKEKQAELEKAVQGQRLTEALKAALAQKQSAQNEAVRKAMEGETVAKIMKSDDADGAGRGGVEKKAVGSGEKALNEFKIREAERVAEKMGVKASYGDDPIPATLVNQSLTEEREAERPLPPRVVVGDNPEHPWKGDSSAPAHFDPKAETIFINPTWDWKKHEEAVSEQKSLGYWSSASPLHFIRHEIAHWRTWKDDPKRFAMLMESILPVDDAVLDEIRKEVSGRAAEGALEFVAEVFAGTRSGKKYSDTVTKWYHFFGGGKL